MRRLQVISDFTELGSGFKIAMKDMEIRGAGNLLGRDQSGEVCAVGFEMYLHLLNTAIERLTSSGWQAPDETLMELEYTGFIPDSYISDAQTKMELESLKGVAKVNAHLDYAQSFVTIRNVVSVVSLILIVILVFVSFFIMSNTIKLATFGRREEIAIMKMVGATNAFIRLPFVIEGLILGMLGGGLAFLAEWGLYNVVTGKLVGSLTGSFLNVVPFQSVALEVFIIYMAVGILVGAFGGVNAIKNYLKV